MIGIKAQRPARPATNVLLSRQIAQSAGVRIRFFNAILVWDHICWKSDWSYPQCKTHVLKTLDSLMLMPKYVANNPWLFCKQYWTILKVRFKYLSPRLSLYNYWSSLTVKTHLNIFLILQQRGFHEVSQHEIIRLNIKYVASDVGDAFPVSRLHCFTCHQLQQWTRLVEVVDSLAKVFIRLPLLQRLGQLPTSVTSNSYFTSRLTWNFSVFDI